MSDQPPRYPHGTHDPHRGWYDASIRGWVDRPDKLTKVGTPRGPARSAALDGNQWRETPRTGDEARDAGHAASWRPDPNMEQLRQLRDSDRADDRATFDKLVKGTQRMSLDGYEKGLAAYLAAGGELPDGVRKP